MPMNDRRPQMLPSMTISRPTMVTSKTITNGHVLRESNISLEHVLGDNEEIRKTKIVCTLGPACWSVQGLGELIDAGMNVARLNFSHGDHETHAATLDRLREALATRPGVHVGVMLDTKGPEIRTGFLGTAKTVEYKKGSIVEIVTDYSMAGTSEIIACSYAELPTTTRVGATILVADGALVLKVTEIRAESVMAEVQNTAVIGERKNMNLPGAIVNLPTLTEKDVADLTDFAVPQNVDFVAASFVRKGEDIDYIRNVLGEGGSHIKIIAKIEVRVSRAPSHHPTHPICSHSHRFTPSFQSIRTKKACTTTKTSWRRPTASWSPEVIWAWRSLRRRFSLLRRWWVRLGLGMCV